MMASDSFMKDLLCRTQTEEWKQQALMKDFGFGDTEAILRPTKHAAYVQPAIISSQEQVTNGLNSGLRDLDFATKANDWNCDLFEGRGDLSCVDANELSNEQFAAYVQPTSTPAAPLTESFFLSFEQSRGKRRKLASAPVSQFQSMSIFSKAGGKKYTGLRDS
jgi:hypothetical protein